MPLPWLLLPAAALALAHARPAAAGGAAVAWLTLVAAVATLAGLELGSARLRALDAAALVPPAGAEVTVTGAVASTPRIGSEVTRFALDSPAGRIGVDAGAEATTLEQGEIVAVSGRSRPVRDWELGVWQRQRVRAIVVAREVERTGGRRGGLAGLLDGIRSRAHAALGSGTSEPAAALLRGFVLGEDDRIAEPVREEFRRSGLAHVLAVSGQNVMLLALLALPLLGLAGLPLRARLLGVALLIALYVPVAGAGPSIQRAGVMGLAGVAATLAGRPRAGWYALGLAALVTLALDPRACADVGWQLSFAAVAGMFLLARPLARALGAPAGAPAAGGLRAMLREGAAITVAATAATAPLVAHHFGVVSLTALPANLVALPAIAPAMWLGMLSGALGQLPGAPVEPLTMLGGLCAGFVGWAAHAMGGPSAQLELPAPGPAATLLWTLALALGLRLACAAALRRRTLRPRSPLRGRPARSAVALAALASIVLALGALLPRGGARPPAASLELRVLDVGQGDAILLRPRGSDPLLVDTGPPGAAVERLAELGVERLAALVITHDQLDHAGGLSEVTARYPTQEIVIGPGPAPRACRHAGACPPVERVAAGTVLRVGRLRLEVLWPPAGSSPDDANAGSLVLLVRHRSFEALLTGDAEAELSGYEARPVELLKVAHHGSADAGLAELLERAAPQLAVISVGEENPFGHPAPETLAQLDAAGVPVRRTDHDGELVVRVRGDGWTVE